jgi:cyclic pyranopterin phosphate synthase
MTYSEFVQLADSFGRVATDLRVSLTDRCNLRCTYCMPAEGMQWLPGEELLTDDEVVRLVGVATGLLGVTSVRFTGGEPLLRPGLESIVSRVRTAAPDIEIALTTNGIGLADRAEALARAGLSRINVSLDTLSAERFRAIARRDRLDDVLAGLHAAAAAGLQPVKVNSVLVRGVNDDEALSLTQFCLDHGFEPRFIEQMPLDADQTWQRENVITAEEILTALRRRFVLTPMPGRGSSPAERWLVDGGPASVGVIASVTQPFCRACDRTRLTADGQVRNCLFATNETDLRGALRSDATDADIAELWRVAMWGKAAAHGGGTPDQRLGSFAASSRSMSLIGG